MSENNASSKDHFDIVIVGGGAGGLELATALCKKTRQGRNAQRLPVRVTLVDKYLSHLWKPRLHEVAVGLQSIAEAEISFPAHAYQHGYQFEWGALDGLDAGNKTIAIASTVSSDGTEVLPHRTIRYDALVLAVGSDANDFHTPGAKDHCLFLNDRNDAQRIRSTLLSGLLRLSRNLIPSLQVAVIGGGATGVELAADLYRSSAHVGTYGGRIDPSALRVTVCDAAPRLLAANPPAVSQYAAEMMERYGAILRLNTRVSKVDAQAIYTQDGEAMPSDIKIWTAGIKGPTLLSRVGAPGLQDNGRVSVDDWLCTSDPAIYALGDCAQWIDPDTKKPAPYTAQVASAQAVYLAKSLLLDRQREPAVPFRFQSKGALVALGDKTAAGNLTSRWGRNRHEHILQGGSAKILYASLYREHQFRVLGPTRTVAIMLSDWLTHKTGPALKLH
jgi:NADH dehydrogenase